MSENSVTKAFDDSGRQQLLETVMAEYTRACDAGAAPNRQVFLERYPELAEDLRDFFSNHDRMDRFAQPLAPSVPPYGRSTLIRAEAEQVGLCIVERAERSRSRIGCLLTIRQNAGHRGHRVVRGGSVRQRNDQ
ncbi:MAG: hypothetical protein HZA46_14415 [Planctomycetales bacterium]|nr:hypothetical protein [Planctomycetales bacterium]